MTAAGPKSLSREKLEIGPASGTGLSARLAELNVNGGAGDRGGVQTNARPHSTFAKHDSAGEGGQEAQEDGPTLMEQMMADAMAAKAEKADKERKQERQRAKKEFGGGLKRGFLSGGGGSRAKTTGGAKGGAATAPSGSRGKADDIPFVKAKMPAKGAGAEGVAGAGGSPSMVLPEVQEAMRAAAANPALPESFTSGKWATPEFVTKIAANPRLAGALQTPQFIKAMELMTTDPKKALALFDSQPENKAIFLEIVGMVWEQVGAPGKNPQGQDAEGREGSGSGPGEGKNGTDGAGGGEIRAKEAAAIAEGPLAREVLRKNAESPMPPAGKQEQEQVERVLAQPELIALLTDLDMQRVLRECQEGGGCLAYYMQHPEFGPKIRTLASAGLVGIAR